MLFQPAHIPASIDSYEALACWALTALNAHGYAIDYNERPPSVVTGDSGIQSICERNGPFTSFQKDARLVFRIAFLLQDDYASSAYTMDYEACKEMLTSSVNVDLIAPAAS